MLAIYITYSCGSGGWGKLVPCWWSTCE